jgi:hypothetical protein
MVKPYNWCRTIILTELPKKKMNNPYQFIASLSPADALRVLQTLAREDDALAARIVKIASAPLKQHRS